MSQRPYTKQATTYARQVEILQERGMTVEDPEQAAFYLSHLNYYRLGAYWLPMEADHATHTFKPGTRFSEVLNLYIFDRELRLLLMDALERFEVSIRTQWAYQMGHRHGAHSHLDPALAHRRDRWQQNLESLEKEVHRSDETFIQHFTATYQESLPPVWAACEVMSLGLPPPPSATPRGLDRMKSPSHGHTQPGACRRRHAARSSAGASRSPALSSFPCHGAAPPPASPSGRAGDQGRPRHGQCQRSLACRRGRKFPQHHHGRIQGCHHWEMRDSGGSGSMCSCSR